MAIDAGTAALIAGMFTALVLTVAWSLGNRHGSKNGFNTGYKEGYHDRQHWETDEVIKHKLQLSG